MEDKLDGEYIGILEQKEEYARRIAAGEQNVRLAGFPPLSTSRSISLIGFRGFAVCRASSLQLFCIIQRTGMAPENEEISIIANIIARSYYMSYYVHQWSARGAFRARRLDGRGRRRDGGADGHHRL